MSDTGDNRAQLHWDEQGQPLSSQFDDVYFSRHNGLAETRHVFLQANNLDQRFRALGDSSPVNTFTIFETGFGTGLNFLATCHLWRQCAHPGARLHFVSVEKYPLAKTDLARALALWPELSELAGQLLEAYPAYLGQGVYRLPLDNGVVLTLVVDDAARGLASLAPSQDPRWCRPDFTVDAWFLDGFAPGKNPEMWSEALFSAIAQLSGPGTSAATFSAAGVVKRGLIAAGFAIEKTPGFGRKRDMLQAQWQRPSAALQAFDQHQHGLLQRATQPPGEKHAVVIGAGLAGCHTARALAERGWRVTVLEKANSPATAGSGNPQGLLYTKLSHRPDTLPLFNLASLIFAQAHYRPYWQEGTVGQRCGLLQMGDSETQKAIVAALQHPDDLLQWVDAQQASALAGVALERGGLYFPQCGWLNPPALCEVLLKHTAISLHTGRECAELERSDGQWRLLARNREELAHAEVVVIACAQHSRALAQTQYLPLKPIRGQVTYLPANAASERLKIALCERGYLAPASGGRHCAGATFNLWERELAPTARDNRENLAHVQRLSRTLAHELASADTATLSGRAAFRCATPDYLPIVGPAPVADSLRTDFAPLAKNAKTRIDRQASYWPGLYVNCGHGSRGLAYTPLCAELLASLINREPLPVTSSLARALHPGRFLLRDIIRSQDAKPGRD